MRTDFCEQTILIYGRPKVGKSTFASHFPGAVFLATEPGLKHLRVRQIPEDGEGLRDYEECRAAVNAIFAGDPKAETVKTIVIDTVDALAQHIERAIVIAKKIAHISDIPNNAGYSLVNAEIERFIRAISQRKQGVVLMSHMGEEEVSTPQGKVGRATSSLRGKIRAFVHGFVDVILYADVNEVADRETGELKQTVVLRTKPNTRWEAGERNGLLPATLPMDWEVFRKAWEDGVRRKREAEAAKK